MSDAEQNNTLMVQPSEAGQKLLQFLVRRLGLSQSLLHRWIRTGQIRVNGGRSKPFVHIAQGDIVRIPPFAHSMSSSAKLESVSQASTHLPLPEIIYEDEHILVFNKPSGLPVHTGTGHTDSLATRLGNHFEQAAFKPTPAHRLDKDTSGIMLVARSYAALRILQDAFEQRTVIKEYLTWVHGVWPHDGPKALRHSIGKSYEGYDEKVRILTTERGRDSESIVTCLHHKEHYSLMHIRLITGRTHQIRVQMATEGFPVIGDGKYGEPQGQEMRLHALRITLPNSDDFTRLGLGQKSFMVFPSWNGWQSVENVNLTVDD